MKKTFAFVLAIILLCPVALADTLREQVNAPMEHKGTYNSPSGKSHIYVDALVFAEIGRVVPRKGVVIAPFLDLHRAGSGNNPDLPGVCPRTRRNGI